MDVVRYCVAPSLLLVSHVSIVRASAIRSATSVFGVNSARVDGANQGEEEQGHDGAKTDCNLEHRYPHR